MLMAILFFSAFFLVLIYDQLVKIRRVAIQILALMLATGKRTESEEGMKNGSGCIVLMILLILNALPGGVATEYLVEFWTRYFGQPVDIPFWAAAIAGIFVAEFTIPAAILTWIVSLFM